MGMNSVNCWGVLLKMAGLSGSVAAHLWPSHSRNLHLTTSYTWYRKLWTGSLRFRVYVQLIELLGFVKFCYSYLISFCFVKFYFIFVNIVFCFNLVVNPLISNFLRFESKWVPGGTPLSAPSLTESISSVFLQWQNLLGSSHSTNKTLHKPAPNTLLRPYICFFKGGIQRLR